MPVLLLLTGLAHPVLAASAYRFAIVPQQSPTTVVRLWQPLVRQLEEATGIKLELVTYSNIETFHRMVAAGRDDFLYLNPQQYVRAHALQGYRPLVRERGRHIHGILVVRRNSSIATASALQRAKIAFPAPTAFAASVLVQSWLSGQGVGFSPAYVGSHDSVYLNVVRGIYPAGGGILRTLNMQPPAIRNALRILVTTPGFTPHALAAHPRVPETDAERVRRALMEMDTKETGRRVLHALAIHGWVPARNEDWNDVRQLKTEASP